MLVKQDDITLIEVKDYIKTPKPNGYRNYHMIVEIQIRTVAMDFWASLEHQLKYKKDIDGSQSIEDELNQCADTIASTDRQMMSLKNRIEEV